MGVPDFSFAARQRREPLCPSLEVLGYSHLDHQTSWNICPKPLDILRRELALILDVGKPMVELCYLSEGDNVLAPRVHNDLKPVHAMMRAIDNPTVRSVAAEFAQKYPTNKVDDIVEQTCKKAEKVATVFLDLFYTKHLTVTRLWGFCSLFFPPSVVETKSRENMVTKINMFMIELLDHHTDNLRP